MEFKLNEENRLMVKSQDKHTKIEQLSTRSILHHQKKDEILKRWKFHPQTLKKGFKS